MVLVILQQIEPRIDLQSNPPAAGVNTSDPSYEFIITAAGSYYLSANLSVTKPNGIQINAEGVTLYLEGFQISRASGAGGHGIEIVPSAHRTTISHGTIKGFFYGIRSMEGMTGGFPRAGGFDHLAVSSCSVDVDAGGNFVIKNSATGNAPNYDIVGGNIVGTIVATEAAMNGAVNGNINVSF